MEVQNLDKIRVDEQLATLLKSEVLKFDNKAVVFVFGSRADKSKKGGDHDFLLLTTIKLSSQQLREIRMRLFENFGEQKFDLVNYTFEEKAAFKDLIMNEAVGI
ncbi:MAG: hypothetical protein RJQ09_13950 [Cyclobacteriaceae bacterium]